jgi:hypothetical protein
VIDVDRDLNTFTTTTIVSKRTSEPLLYVYTCTQTGKIHKRMLVFLFLFHSNTQPNIKLTPKQQIHVESTSVIAPPLSVVWLQTFSGASPAFKVTDDIAHEKLEIKSEPNAGDAVPNAERSNRTFDDGAIVDQRFVLMVGNSEFPLQKNQNNGRVNGCNTSHGFHGRQP